MTENQDILTKAIDDLTRKVAKDVDASLKARRETEREMQQELAAQGAAIAALGQKLAGGLPGGAQAFGASPRGGLGKAAQAVADGMQNATSFRTSLPFGIKALVGDTPGINTDDAAYALPPTHLGPVNVYATLARILDVLPMFPVGGNAVQYVRVNYDTSGNNAAIAPEGSAKAESEIAVTEVVCDLLTWAHFCTVSKQVLSDVPALRLTLDGILRDGLLDVVDAGIYSTLTTPGNFTAFNAESDDFVGDSVARISAQIATAGGRGIVVCLAPDDFLTMQLQKASTSGTYLGTPQSLAARVLAIPTIGAGKVLAFSPGSGATWALRENVTVQAGLTADNFTKNLVTLLAECRGNVMTRDVQHVAYGDVLA